MNQYKWVRNQILELNTYLANCTLLKKQLRDPGALFPELVENALFHSCGELLYTGLHWLYYYY